MLLPVLAVALIVPHAKPVVISREESARHYLLGVAHVLQGNRLRAAWEFTHAVHFNPTNTEAWLARAMVFDACQLADQAIADYSRVLRIGPNADAYLHRAYWYEKRKDHKAAVADLTKALELDSRNEHVWRLRGFSRVQMGETEAAIADFTRSFELNPHSAETLRFRGGTYARRGDAANAFRDLNAALELDPDDGTALTFRATVHFETGNPDQAASDFARALRLDPNNQNAIHNRAVMNFRLGYDLRAAADLDRLIALKPNDPEAYTLRAELHARSGDREIAIRDYTRLIVLNPKNADLYRKRATVHTTDGNHPAALADLEKVAELEPNAESYRALAWFHLNCTDAKLKNSRQAVEFADRAWALERLTAPPTGRPHDTRADELRAAAAAAAGDLERAVSILTGVQKSQSLTVADHERVKERIAFYQQLMGLKLPPPIREVARTAEAMPKVLALPPLTKIVKDMPPGHDGLPPIIIPVIPPVEEVVKKE